MSSNLRVPVPGNLGPQLNQLRLHFSKLQGVYRDSCYLFWHGRLTSLSLYACLVFTRFSRSVSNILFLSLFTISHGCLLSQLSARAIMLGRSPVNYCSLLVMIRLWFTLSVRLCLLFLSEFNSPCTSLSISRWLSCSSCLACCSWRSCCWTADKSASAFSLSEDSFFVRVSCCV